MNKKFWLQASFGVTLLLSLIALYAGKAKWASHFFMWWKGSCHTGGGSFVTQGLYNCYGLADRLVIRGGYALIVFAAVLFILVIWNLSFWGRVRPMLGSYLARRASTPRKHYVRKVLGQRYLRILLAGGLTMVLAFFAVAAWGLAMIAENSIILGILFSAIYFIASILLFVPGLLANFVDYLPYNVAVGTIFTFIEILLLFELLYWLFEKWRGRIPSQPRETLRATWRSSAAAFLLIIAAILLGDRLLFKDFAAATQPLGPLEYKVEVLQTGYPEFPYRKNLDGKEAVAYINDLTGAKYFLPKDLEFVAAGNFSGSLPDYAMIENTPAKSGIFFLFYDGPEIFESIRGSELRPLPELQNSQSFKTENFTWEMGEAVGIGGTVAIGSRGDLVVYLRTVEGPAYNPDLGREPEPPKDLRAFIEANF